MSSQESTYQNEPKPDPPPPTNKLPNGPPPPPPDHDPVHPVEPEPKLDDSPSVLSYLINAALALVFGFGGAYAYERMKARTFDPHRATVKDDQADNGATEPRATQPAGESPTISTSLDSLDKRIDKLTERVEGLRVKVDESVQGPSTASRSDVDAIRQKVIGMEQTIKSFASLPGTVEHLNNKVDEVSSAAKLNHDDIAELKTQYLTRSVRDAAPSPRDGLTRRASVETPRDIEDPAFAKGVDLYKDGKYKEAFETFRQLESDTPDDARVCYYAALADGFANNGWAKQSVELVEKGIAREKAGTPSKSEIDAAFRGLTKASGKEWLAVYRQRAESPK